MNTAILLKKQQVSLEERPLPNPGPGELLVEVAYCGVCRTDRKAYHQGQRDLRLPRVLGHEFAGIVVAIGDGVTGYALGDRVQVHPGIGCGVCPDCLHGNDQRCEKMQILGFHLDGGFGRFCRIPAVGVDQGIVSKVPPGLPLHWAALTEPIACALHMLEQIKMEGREQLLIVGGGVLGCMTAKLCRHLKITEQILIVEANPNKRALVAKLGFATAAVAEAEALIKRTWPDGVDAAIPCCPVNFGLELSLNTLKNGGKLGFFSGLSGNIPLSNRVINLMHYKELTVTGAYGCGLKDSKQALALLAAGFDLSDLPITMISLDGLENTLCQLDTKHDLITMIKYEKEKSHHEY